MLQLQITIQTDSYCDLTVEDTTGFISGSNLNGFLAEGATADVDQYHISDGYFFNILTYDYYSCSPGIQNSSDVPVTVSSGDVEPIYTDNDFVYKIKMTKDGIHTIHRFFIISKSFYEAQTLEFFDGKLVVYYDPAEDLIYKVDGLTIVSITKEELVALVLDETITGGYVYETYTSLCYLNALHYKLENKLLNSGILSCPAKVDKGLIAARDYVYMALNVISYLQELGQELEVQRLIESIWSCVLPFTDLLNVKLQDCGCIAK